MNRYRIKFSKLGKIIYIGHLDLLKVFQRAIKRANIPIAYSEGFNPHQKVSFAIPLPLGMESICEYVDIMLEENLQENEILKRLNEQMPLGIEILNVKKLKENEPNGASIVSAGEYYVTLDRKINIGEFNKKIEEILNLPVNIGEFNKKIEEILNLPEINVEKIAKKKGRKILKTTNIKDCIYKIEPINENTIKIFIATGSAKNLKPDILMEYIYKNFGFEYDKLKIIYKRTALKKEEDGKFIELDK